MRHGVLKPTDIAAECYDVLEELDHLHEDLDRAINECVTISALAESLGSAIGWDTPGATWIDKAHFLKHFYNERNP